MTFLSLEANRGDKRAAETVLSIKLKDRVLVPVQAELSAGPEADNDFAPVEGESAANGHRGTVSQQVFSVFGLLCHDR